MICFVQKKPSEAAAACRQMICVLCLSRRCRVSSAAVDMIMDGLPLPASTVMFYRCCR